MSDGLREQLNNLGWCNSSCGEMHGICPDKLMTLILERSKAVVIEMIQLSDQIELEDGTPSMEEWKAFKHFRNTMRDRYGITADEVPYKLAHPTGEGAE